MSKGRQSSPEEYEDFAKRMINSVDDLDYTANSADWEEFVRTKIDPTPAQLDVLREYRTEVWQIQFEAGFSREVVEPRPGLQQKIIRDESTGRFISKSVANQMLSDVLPRIFK